MQWISHRGESADAPENTLSSFKLAMERNTDGMETDIHLTSDGVLVCCHDANLKRTCGIDMVIEETPLETVRKADACNGKEAYKGEKIPLFSEALAVLKPGKLFYVEIKENDERVIDKMMAEIRQSDVKPEQIVMISFHADIVREFKARYPEQKALWLSSLNQHGDTRPEVYYPEFVRSLKADGIDAHCNKDVASPAMVKAFTESGMIYATWTLDTEEICDYFIQAGVTSITSNCAWKMRQIQNAKR